MSVTSSRRHQFTLRQLLAWLTVSCVGLALAAPCLRRIVDQNDIILLLVVTSLSAGLLIALMIRLGLAPLRADSTTNAVIDEAVAHGVGVLGLLTYLSIIASAWVRFCREFEVPVGVPETLVFDASATVMGYPYLAVPLAAALVAADCRGLALLRRDSHGRWLATSWSVLITVFLLATMAFIMWALVRVPFGIFHGMRVHYPF